MKTTYVFYKSFDNYIFQIYLLNIYYKLLDNYYFINILFEYFYLNK